MDMGEYKRKIEEVLQAPLTTDSPDTLFKEVAVIESLAYLAVKWSGNMESQKSRQLEDIRKKKQEVIVGLKGTQLEKATALEAALATDLRIMDATEHEIRYWKSIGKLIENKVSLAQSILANITSQIKSNMYYENIK